MKKWIVKKLLKCSWFKTLVEEELKIKDLNWTIEDLRAMNKELRKDVADRDEIIEKYVALKEQVETAFNSDINTIIEVIKNNIAKFLPFFTQPKPKRKYNKKK